MSDRPKTHYAVLGVRRDASGGDISAAYRLLAMSLRPNHRPGDEASEAEFARVHEAYQVLSDPEARARYEAELAKGPNPVKIEQPPEEEAAGALDPMADAPEDPMLGTERAIWKIVALLGAAAAARGAIGAFCAPQGFAWRMANKVADLSTDQCFIALVAGLGLMIYGGASAMKTEDSFGGFLFRDGKPHPPPPRTRSDRRLW